MRKKFIPDPEKYEREFWAKVNIQAEGCWLWGAGTSPARNGRRGIYSRTHLDRPDLGRRNRTAYRVAWELAYKSFIPAGKLVCHTCDNGLCVRPSHLFLGTSRDNQVDCVMKGRCTQAKLTPGKVLEIREKQAGGAKNVVLAKEYGVSHETIKKIKSRRLWGHLISQV